MGTSGFGSGRRAGARGRRWIAATLVAGLLAAVALLPGMAAAEVLYPPRLGVATKTAEGFELHGTVYNYGGTTTYHFEYGTSTAYGSSAPVPDADAGPALASSVSAQVTGLAPDTTYHWRLVSTNSVEGTAASADGTFSTAETTAPPTGGGSGGQPTQPGQAPPGTTPGKESKEGTGAGAASPSAPPPVATGQGPKKVAKSLRTKAGTLLTTLKGRTLYTLSVEKHGKFVCTEASGCTSIWPPLLVGAGVVPQGPTKLGTIKRPDGTLQVTFHGMPLYTFASDKKPGQAKGEGLKDVGTWHAAKLAANGPKQGPGAYAGRAR
jgi:predicted lipoprotein with Yx(FWY)xxD motif